MRSHAALAFTVIVALGSLSGMTIADDEKLQTKPTQPRNVSRVNISGSEVFFSGMKGDPQISHYMIQRAIQREIGITDEQAVKIDTILRREGGRSNRLLLELRNTRGREKRAEIGARLTPMCIAMDEHVKAVLEPAQVRRLTELQVQFTGLRALLIPKVAEALALGRDQQSRLKEVLSPLMPLDSSFEIVAAQAEKVRPQVEGILTEEQKEKFRRLAGKPFDPEKHRTDDREIPVRE